MQNAKPLCDLSKFRVVGDVLDWVKNFINKRTLVFVGASGTGKTRYIQSLLMSLGYTVIRTNLPDSMKKIKQARRINPKIVVVFDDFPCSTVSQEDCLHMLDPTQQHTQNVKHRTVGLPACPRVVICNRIPEMFLTNEAIKRRLLFALEGNHSLFLEPEHTGGASLEKVNMSPSMAKQLGIMSSASASADTNAAKENTIRLEQSVSTIIEGLDKHGCIQRASPKVDHTETPAVPKRGTGRPKGS